MGQMLDELVRKPQAIGLEAVASAFDRSGHREAIEGRLPCLRRVLTVGLSPRSVRGLTLWIGRSCGNRLPENGKKNPGNAEKLARNSGKREVASGYA